MKAFGFVIFLLLNVIASVEAATTWVNSYTFGAFNINTDSLVATSDGGYLAVDGNALMKLDAQGQAQWYRSYDCSCGFAQVIEVPGGYAASAGVFIQEGENAILVMRLDASGNLVWSKRYHNKLLDEAGPILRTRDGGYLVAGYSGNLRSHKDANMWLFKVGGAGLIQWQKTYNVSRPTSISQLSNGDYLVGTIRFSILRINALGVVRWQKKYIGVAQTCCSEGIMRTSANAALIAGTQGNSVVTMMIDFTGAIQWGRQFSASSGAINLGIRDFIATRGDGGLLLAQTNVDSPNRTIIIRVNASGNLQWKKAYLASTGELLIPHSIQSALDGGFVFATFRRWILKLDALGNIANGCRNIVRPVSIRSRPISIKVERHFPTVVRTNAVPVAVTFGSQPGIPTVQAICPATQ